MTQLKKIAIAIACISGASATQVSAAETLTEALSNGTTSADIRIRHETLDVDAAALNSERLTVRTRFNYKTEEFNGFSAFAEVEDVRTMLGIDDSTGIPDPEVTEIDQAFIQYKNDSVKAKVGRQVITLDGHRFIGHVGWRQDRQTFDAVRLTFTPIEDLTVDTGYIYQRNRIFAETADAESSDVFVNLGYKSPIGKLTAYAYLLDDELRDEQSDTYGVSLKGKTGLSGDTKLLYSAEFATQTITDAGIDYDTDYAFAEVGLSFSKALTVKLGYELLGSDDGNASFTTPLATLHKFNGWADVFLGESFNPVAGPGARVGLEDVYASVISKLGPVKLVGTYHDFSADEGSADRGSEIDLLAAYKFNKTYSAGVKYSDYSAGDTGSDLNRIWVWVGAKF